MRFNRIYIEKKLKYDVWTRDFVELVIQNFKQWNTSNFLKKRMVLPAPVVDTVVTCVVVVPVVVVEGVVAVVTPDVVVCADCKRR